MTDEARRLLSLLGVLPDGIAHEDLNEVLPQAGDRAANVLRRVGLAFDLGDRLRVLAPIREYVARKHPPSPDDLARAVAHYGALAEKYGPLAGKEGGAKAVQRLATETANLEGMIRAGLKQEDPRPSIRAACALTDLIRFSGLGTPCVLEKARDVAQAKGIEVGQANCIKSLGNIALRRWDHAAAQALYEEALRLYQRAEDVQGEVDVQGKADCIQKLGDRALARWEYTEAETRYKEALRLYQRAGHDRGQAKCIKGLGNIALARSHHSAAQTQYKEAWQLYQRAGDDRGQADCIKRLGDSALAQSDHETAQKQYKEALRLSRSVGDVLGEANCIQGLGRIALAR